MNYINTNDQNAAPEQKDNRKVIYGILIVALLATWAYIFYDKSRTTETIGQLETRITNVCLVLK